MLITGGTACAHTAGDPALRQIHPRRWDLRPFTVRSRARVTALPGPDPRCGIDWNHPDLSVEIRLVCAL